MAGSPPADLSTTHLFRAEPLTYLVTGGAGFIGSHLAEALLRRGDRVVVVDDLSTGRLENLALVADHPGLRVVTGSSATSWSSTSWSTLATWSSTWPPRSGSAS